MDTDGMPDASPVFIGVDPWLLFWAKHTGFKRSRPDRGG
jgi:hypothetical protein